MNTLNVGHDKVSLSLSFEELYVLLQCVVEIGENRTDADIEAIFGVKREYLKTFSNELNEIKKAMFSARGHA